MEDAGKRERGRLRSFVLGGIVGASAAIAASARRKPQPKPRRAAGLAAFEDAPCYRELTERER